MEPLSVYAKRLPRTSSSVGFVNEAVEAELKDKSDDKIQDKSTNQENSSASAYLENVPVTHEDHSCGYGRRFRPKSIQKLANPKMYLFVMCICVTVQSFAVSGINNVNTATYERRYQLSSTQSGMVSSIFDIVAGLTVLFVGYFGAKSHHPKLLAVAALCLSLGCFTMVLTHIVSPIYTPLKNDTNTSETHNLCLKTTIAEDTCQAEAEDATNLKNYLYLLLLGQGLNGFAGTCFYTIGITFMDDNVDSHSSPLYIGILMSMTVLGPAVGFIAGGSFLNIYVDSPLHKPPEGINSDDPRWVGAWWLGFLLTSILSGIMVPMLCCFPRELPGVEELRQSKVSEAHDNGADAIVNHKDFTFTLKNLPTIVWLLMKNPTYLFSVLKHTCLVCVSAGFITFAAKFLQIQFRVDASWSAMLTGLTGVPSAVLGQLLGGIISNKKKLKVRGLYRFLLITSTISLCVSPMFWIKCKDQAIFGLTTGRTGQGQLEVECNQDCECQSAEYEPICYNDLQYFSPCHAGCQTAQYKAAATEEATREFSNCQCINETIDSSTGEPAKLLAGACSSQCNVLYLFISLIFVLSFCLAMQATPFTTILLRIVPEKKRSSAIAMQWIFVRFLGNVPGPILIGYVLDSSCQVWQSSCGVTGSCWLYSNYDVAWKMFVLITCFLFANLFFNILAMLTYKPPKTATQSYTATSSLNESASTQSPTPDVDPAR